MAVSLDQFTKQVVESGVISDEDLQAFIKKLPEDQKPTDGEQLAKRLVKEKKISAYQAQVVYSGKGKTLTMGSYFVLDKLGQGGMGMVVKAEHRMMKRLVAIKVLSPAVTKTKESQQRFQREVEAAARLTHPNIVGAFDAGQADGSPFLVMEYVPGDDLSAIVKKKGPLSVDQAIDCIAQAARGLEFAHEQGVIHRDIKPANLLLDTSGNVKILDMGLARIDANDVATQADLTGTGAVMGTVDYMAPEQAVSTKTADARSDLYSLGISLWFLLTAKSAYEGDSLMSRLLAHRDQPIPSLRAVREDVSESLDAVFRKLVAKQPTDRYQTATELMADLEACRTGASVKALVVAEVATDADDFQDFLQQLDGPTIGPRGSQSSPSVTGTKTQARARKSITSMDETMERGNVSDTLPPARRVRKGGKSKSPPWFQDIRVQIGGGAAAVLLLLAAIFLFQTPNGRLRVEILDPEVEVKVQGTTVTLKAGDTEPVTLKVGNKKLLVTRGDLSFETDSFTLKKGTETKVKVDLVADSLIATSGGKVIGEKSIGRKTLTTSTTGGDSAALISQTPSASLLPNTSALSPAVAPFDAAQAKVHQEAWAKHLGTQVETTNSVGAKMVLIPPGEFLMGSTDEQVEAALKVANEIKADSGVISRIEKAERPQHKVVITKPLLMSATEVTIGQFKKFVEASKYVTEAEQYGSGDSSGQSVDDKVTDAQKQRNWRTPGYAVTDDWPVVQITWNDAVAYCQWLSTQEKTTYRLPTEAEWEYACQAGTTTQYSFGDDYNELPKYGWHNKNAGGKSHPVGTLLPNPFGLFDMYGDLYEWCGDYYDEKWYSTSPPNDPNGPSVGSNRVLRGGGWNEKASNCRSASRHYGTPSYRHFSSGFRVARELDAPATTASVTPQSATPIVASPPPRWPYDPPDGREYVWSKPENLGPGVNSSKRDLNPTLTSDELTLIFNRDNQLFLARRENRDEPFAACQPLPGPMQKFGVGSASLTGDGLELFLSDNADSHDFWLSKRSSLDQPFGEPVKLGPPVNSSHFDEIAEISSDGLTLCISSMRPDPQKTAGSGVYLLRRKSRDEPFGEATNLGPNVNTSGYIVPNWISSDGLVLLTTIMKQKPWPYLLHVRRSIAEPFPPGEPFGEPFEPASAWFSPDGRRLYFHSRDIAGGFGDLDLWMSRRVPVTKTAASAAPPIAKAPFDVAQAKAHQAVWSKHLGTTVETTNSVGAKMILIPPGEFLMGSADEQVEAALKVADEINADQQTKVQIQKSERPQHKVVITKPLLMSATEVTIGQFKKFTAATGYQTEAEKRATDAKTNTYLDAASDDFPAAYINWNDATAYCQWLSTQEKTTYRLPTEAEWEYACRAGTTTQYSFGDDYNELTKYGWHNQNAGAKSHPVGTLLPNNFGLFDMHGNLHEWCGDYFGEKWYAESALNDPNGPSVGSIRVFRGGYWSSNASHCRSAYRHALSPVSRNNYFGFRCVRVLDAPATTASVTPQSAVAAASSTKLFMHDPAFPKWMKDVQAMPAEKQLEAVSKKLMELNPGLDGKLTAYSGPSKIKDGVVTDLGFVADHVTDISPLRALSQLKALNCSSSTWKGTLADLRPLQGMQLKKLRLQGNTSLTDISPLQGMLLDELDFYVCYQLTDLKPLQGMPITTLHIGNTKANDLSPLHGMPLKKLNLFNCPARDLSPLEGMPLEALTIHNFDKVEDFTPIQSLPLRAIHCVSSTERDLALFRSLKTVNTINGKPAAEFWKEVEEQKGKKP